MDRDKTLRMILAFLVLVISAFSFAKSFDNQAVELTERSLERAVAAFGIARGLNGVISVAQGTEFSVEPLGLGIVFTPGEILDPINDLVEQISWVMLAASTSFGIQEVLLNIASVGYIRAFVGLAFAILALTLWWTTTERVRMRACKITLALLVLRFGIATLAVGGELLFSEFLDGKYKTASIELTSTTEKLTALNSEVTNSAAQAGGSTAQASGSSILGLEWLKPLGQMVSQMFISLNINTRLDQYKAAAETMSKSAIDLVVVFVFQTILFPIVFLFVLLSVTRSLLRI